MMTNKTFRNFKKIPACTLCLFLEKKNDTVCNGQGFKKTSDVYNSKMCKKLYWLQLTESVKDIDGNLTRKYRLDLDII